jgi:uroporphyrinogen-III synthase
VVAVPTIRIVPPRAGGALDRALRRLGAFDWVIATSANGAHACIARARALAIDISAPRPRWAAIGPATASVLRDAGVRVAMTPSRFLTHSIVEEFPDVRGRRILLPRTDAAPPGLAEALRARGAHVEQVTAYRTLLAPAQSRARIHRYVARPEIDTVIVTSASTVHGLVRLLGDQRSALERVEIACIGPVTAAAAVEEGFRPAIVAETHTVDGLVAALVARHGGQDKGERHARDRAAR